MTPEDVVKLADEYAICRAEYWTRSGSTESLRRARDALISAIHQLYVERDNMAGSTIDRIITGDGAP